jgi:hypothetical protein
MGSLRSILRESVLDDRTVVLEEPPIYRGVSETNWSIRERDGRRDLTLSFKLPHHKIFPGSVSIRVQRYGPREMIDRYRLFDIDECLVVQAESTGRPLVRFGRINYKRGVFWLRFIHEFYVPLSDKIVVDYRYAGGHIA